MKKLICNIVIFLFVFVSCSQEDIEMMDKVDNQKDENNFNTEAYTTGQIKFEKCFVGVC